MYTRLRRLGQSFARKALYVLLIGAALSTLPLSLSQSGEFPSNETNVTCPANVSCSELDPVCLNCDYNESCVYGNQTEVTCQPMASVECMVRWGRGLFYWHPCIYRTRVCVVLGRADFPEGVCVSVLLPAAVERVLL